MQDRRPQPRTGEQGFALVLAILSLMLLTFLGLTLATTTSTELQIATNYRWSQQALYNAEAGLEAARIVLSTVADDSAYWQAQLPALRTGPPWRESYAPPHEAAAATRDFEKDGCDDRGGMGYGRVLSDGTTLYENVSVFPATGPGGQALNGAFTIWIRRPLQVSNAGEYSDVTGNDKVVVVAEGVAPYAGAADAFTRQRQATRVLETSFTLSLGEAGKGCMGGGVQAQEGGSPVGDNFNPCASISEGATGSLADVFGGVGAGTLNAGAR
jgi:hypothetical protein